MSRIIGLSGNAATGRKQSPCVPASSGCPRHRSAPRKTVCRWPWQCVCASRCHWWWSGMPRHFPIEPRRRNMIRQTFRATLFALGLAALFMVAATHTSPVLAEQCGCDQCAQAEQECGCQADNCGCKADRCGCGRQGCKGDRCGGHGQRGHQGRHAAAGQGLFYNYYTQGGAVNAQMYLSPRPTPPLVGHTYITYQPFYPHEFMYTHKRHYMARHGDGGFTRTSVRWGHKHH